MMLTITPEQNARAEGRDCAVEWTGPALGARTYEERRDRCRAVIVREFEGGRDCALCDAGASRENFDHLLAEWERGFDHATKVLYGSPQERADAIKDVAVRANVMCSMLNVTNILPEASRLGNLRTCAHLAAEIAEDILLLVGGEA